MHIPSLAIIMHALYEGLFYAYVIASVIVWASRKIPPDRYRQLEVEAPRAAHALGALRAFAGDVDKGLSFVGKFYANKPIPNVMVRAQAIMDRIDAAAAEKTHPAAPGYARANNLVLLLIATLAAWFCALALGAILAGGCNVTRDLATIATDRTATDALTAWCREGGAALGRRTDLVQERCVPVDGLGSVHATDAQRQALDAVNDRWRARLHVIEVAADSLTADGGAQ